MLIYFAASTYQGKLNQEYKENYLSIIETLEKLGHKVLYEHMMEEEHDKRKAYSSDERKSYYKKFIQWLNKCDMVVMEASYPSTLNIGYEISIALEKNKPVLALYTKDSDSPFLAGNLSDKFLYEEYSPTTLKKILERATAFAEQHTDARFNFFISPKHISFLDFVSRKRRIPKSVYLRELIERDKQKNPDYNEE